MLEIQLIGNLGKDPEARYTPDGVLVCSFSVAATPRKDETVWVEVTAWRELGERIPFLATVQTPNGMGIVQGRLVEDGKPGRILVSHDPHDPDLPEEMRALSHGGIWVLWAYEPEQIQVVNSKPVGRKRKEKIQ
jgi:hypothetical protein